MFTSMSIPDNSIFFVSVVHDQCMIKSECMYRGGKRGTKRKRV